MTVSGDQSDIGRVASEVNLEVVLDGRRAVFIEIDLDLAVSILELASIFVAANPFRLTVRRHVDAELLTRSRVNELVVSDGSRRAATFAFDANGRDGDGDRRRDVSNMRFDRYDELRLSPRNISRFLRNYRLRHDLTFGREVGRLARHVPRWLNVDGPFDVDRSSTLDDHRGRRQVIGGTN